MYARSSCKTKFTIILTYVAVLVEGIRNNVNSVELPNDNNKQNCKTLQKILKHKYFWLAVDFTVCHHTLFYLILNHLFVCACHNTTCDYG